MEELKTQRQLASEEAELQQKMAKEKDREVTETGVSGAPVAGRDERIAGPDGVSERTGAQQDDRRPGTDFDLGARLYQAVADSDVSRDADPATVAGPMLGEGAHEEFLATELPAFQDTGDGVGDVGAVVGEEDGDFAAFLRDYNDREGFGGLFGGEGDGLFSGETVVDEGSPKRVKRAGLVAGELAAGYRFLTGANRANYLSGDTRFQVNCQEAFVAFHNSLKFNREFVAGPAGADRDPARLEAAFGGMARRVAGVAGVEQYVGSGPVGVAVPVIYQRADGSAHVIAAVHSGYRDGRGVVDLLDPQKGEVAEKADVSAVAGMWVIPVSEVAPDREVVLPPGGSGLRSMGWGAGLPAEVAGPKRQSGVSGPVAGEAGTKGTKRTREEAGESSSGASKRRKVTGTVGVDSGNQGGGEPAPQEQPKTDQRAKRYYQKNKEKLNENSAQYYRDNRSEIAVYNAEYHKNNKVELNERRQARDRAAKAAAVGEIANLEALEEQGRLNPEQQAELDLRRGIEADVREEGRLKARVRRAKGPAAEIEALEALQQPTEAEQGGLPALRAKAAGLADSVEQLKKTRRSLAEKKKKLKLMQEAGSAPTAQAAQDARATGAKQRQKERDAEPYRAKKAAIDRVAELEGREERRRSSS
ncbi:hypothetical protein [Saccharopolyspora spinosa]|uniref:hypothetical protein n=1 Tax=Saccharopolyspora spinosa TaxID=60894 RepID=UPI0011D2B89E|nr:hypothetical protein [Saccharopolyspora spinosa]